MSPLIKICGLRRLEDAELALDLGAQFLGCVMAKDSPRCASLNEVQAIVKAAAGRAEVVLVFRGNSAADILSVSAATGVKRVQIHGVDPVACESMGFYGLMIHPVFSVDPQADCLPVQEPVPTVARPGLLDTGRGGSGEPFGWRLLGEQGPAATFVAGGIKPSNLSLLLKRHPYGIDVSSGVEISPGCKDPALLKQLFAIAKAS